MDGEINLGFLGLGQTGGAMAERLLGKGVRLHVFDAGPRWDDDGQPRWT